MDFAELVLSAKTDGLKKGETALDSLADEAERTERRADKATDGMGRAFTGAGATIARAAAGAVVAMASFQQASQAITQARGFSAALAETSTLIDGTAEEMDALSAAARDMAKEFGGSATEQVNAFYSAISGGAESVEAAAETLDAANRLAIGGVTDVTTATGILNAALNTYSGTGLTAIEVSDALFVAMRAGETTIGQLASSLGAVLPFAKQVGVSFDEVAATTAALTKGGISTAQAVTGMRAALLAVISPTQQALELAESLKDANGDGLDFSVSALEAKGFAGFMQEVTERTGGSVEMLAQLFSSSEAAAAAMALAGSAGGFLAANLEDMRQKTGLTAEAFNVVAANLNHRWNRAAAAAGDLALTFGNALLTAVVPALEAFAGAARLVVENLDFFAISLGVLGASQIPTAITALSTLAASTAATRAMFWSGAIAVQGFTAAMNLVPFAAVATGLTLAYRGYTNSRDAADRAAEATKEYARAKDALNGSLTTYLTDFSERSRKAAEEDAKAMLAAAEATLENARAKYQLAQSTNLMSMAEPNRGLQEVLDGIQAVKEARANLELVTDGPIGPFLPGEGPEGINEIDEAADSAARSLADMVEAAERLGGSLSGVQDFGDGFEYLSLQISTLNSGLRDIEEANAAAALDAITAEATAMGDQLGLASDQLATYYLGLADVAMAETFADQAVALAEVIRNLEYATGGAENMGTAALGVYEALLKALNTSISLAGVDYSGSLDGITAQAAHLADTFGIAYGYARALATMEVSSTTQLGFGSDIPSAGDGLGVGDTPLSFGSQGGVTVPRLKLDEPSIPSLGGGGGGRGGGSGGGGKSEAEREANKLKQEGIRLTESLWTEQEKYNDAVAQADRLLDAGAISLDTYNKHMDQLSAELADAQWGDVIDGLTSVSDALVDAAMAGEDMGEAFRNVLQQMVADILKSGIHDLIASMFDGVGSGSGGGGLLGGLVGAIFGGGRANGGDVRPGEVYEVGEQGREWFVPSSQGHIIPNHKIGEGAPARAAVEVIGGNLTLSDGGQIMAEVNVVAAETSAGMVARNNAMIQQKQRRR